MEKIIMERKAAKKSEMSEEVKVNPLTNETVYVRFVPRSSGFSSDIKAHPLYGGLADGAEVKLCVPILRSTGQYKNVLTKNEMEFLEEALNLDYGALSVYRTEGNYWDNYYVRLTKEGIRLNLSIPEDYIRYKVLLANNDKIAPSVQERMDRPKQTYLFEIVREKEESDIETAKMDTTMHCYEELGVIKNDHDTMRVLIELIDGRPYAVNTDINFFKKRANMLIQADAKKFLAAITDPLLHSKVIIRRAKELGKIIQKGDYYYMASDQNPLCSENENPTLSAAARYINLPAHHDIKFLLESEVDKNRV